MTAKGYLTQNEIIASQEIVAQVFRSFRDELIQATGSVEFERKGDFSPVTKWDIAIEEKLKAELQANFPAIGFTGEETGAEGSPHAYWIVDPIDGTSSFIRGLDYCTNMAAYVEDGEVKCSVIYDFMRDDMYMARLGHGAYKNGQRITINYDRREGNLVFYSFSRRTFPLLREAFIELRMRLILPMGGAGHAYALLAQGKIDGIVGIGTGMGLHDIAAGSLLVSEAGAEMLRYDDASETISREFIVGVPYALDRLEKSGLI